MKRRRFLHLVVCAMLHLAERCEDHVCLVTQKDSDENIQMTFTSDVNIGKIKNPFTIQRTDLDREPRVNDDKVLSCSWYNNTTDPACTPSKGYSFTWVVGTEVVVELLSVKKEQEGKYSLNVIGPDSPKRVSCSRSVRGTGQSGKGQTTTSVDDKSVPRGKDEGADNTAVIIGVVAGCLGLVLAAVIAFFLYRCHKANIRRRNATSERADRNLEGPNNDEARGSLLSLQRNEHGREEGPDREREASDTSCGSPEANDSPNGQGISGGQDSQEPRSNSEERSRRDQQNSDAESSQTTAEGGVSSERNNEGQPTSAANTDGLGPSTLGPHYVKNMTERFEGPNKRK